MNVKEQINKKIVTTVTAIWPELKDRTLEVGIEYPTDNRHGDYSTTIAMQLAAVVHSSPMEIAQKIKDNFSPMAACQRIEVAPPGYLNFYLDQKWLLRQAAIMVKEKRNFGREKKRKKERIQVEFISANPTGPLHLGNGRGAFAGDTLATVLDLAGYQVQREYYVNDTGKQVGVLAESVLRRYWQHKGIHIEYPDYCYQGDYVDELAKTLFLPNYKLHNSQKLEVVKDKIKGRILQKMLSFIRKFVTDTLGIKYNKWFSEKSLYTSGQVDFILQQLKERGLLYKSEGAIWLKTSQFGDEKDRVLIKANEEPVYFLSDIAYHWNKFAKRKFDRVIDIWGADHHGYIKRMQAAMQMFGFTGRLEIIITQLVRLIRQGKEVKMSKRSGTFVTLQELVDEVGVDATRFFFLMHDYTTHMDFDMDLAKKKSQDNPVYYVQYAHARICSILRKAKTLSITKSDKRALVEPSEIALMKKLIQWPELIAEVADSYQVHRLTIYAREVATAFHDFYTQCRVINGQLVNERRLAIAKAAQVVLQNALKTMGVEAPPRM